jgi:hypothetical protein
MSVTVEQRWWPSPFGETDELGMLNHVDDAKRRQAALLVREGRVFDLGRVLDENVPVFPGRFFRQTLVTTAHHANAGAGGVGQNEVNWVTEQVAATMQLGTHLDALSHLQIGQRGYNGWSVAELASDAGMKRLGVETVPQIVTRGWLVDVPAARGVERLEQGDAIQVSTESNPSRATRCCSTPAGGRTGTLPSFTWMGSPAQAWPQPPSWPTAGSPSPGATHGATAPSQPRTPSARSRCPKPSTSSAASSSSRTSTPRSSPPPACANSASC